VSTFERLRIWLAAALGLQEEMIKPSSTLGDLFRSRTKPPSASSEGALGPPVSFVDDISPDSLEIVELVMRLEEEFNLELPETAAETLPSRLLDNSTTVQELADWIDAISA
jgi:acyl carrier protein